MEIMLMELREELVILTLLELVVQLIFKLLVVVMVQVICILSLMVDLVDQVVAVDILVVLSLIHI